MPNNEMSIIQGNRPSLGLRCNRKKCQVSIS